MKAFGKLYITKTLGQSTNNLGSSNQPCRLKRAIEKLCTIHFQVGTLIRIAFSRRMRFMLCEGTTVITAVELDTPTNKRPMPSTETEWCKVLQGLFDRQELLFDGTPEEAQANEKIVRKALAQGSPIMHCKCLLVAYLSVVALFHRSRISGCRTYHASHVFFGCRRSANVPVTSLTPKDLTISGTLVDQHPH